MSWLPSASISFVIWVWWWKANNKLFLSMLNAVKHLECAMYAHDRHDDDRSIQDSSLSLPMTSIYFIVFQLVAICVF